MLVKTEPHSAHMIEVTFNNEVRLLRSKLEFSALMILTTMGGHIGVCRTCLWIGLSLAGIKNFWAKLELLFH